MTLIPEFSGELCGVLEVLDVAPPLMYSSIPGLNSICLLGDAPGDCPGVVVGEALLGGTGGGAVVAMRRVTMGEE